MHTTIRVTTYSIIVLVLVYLYGRYFQYRQLYHPTGFLEVCPSDIGLPYESISFTAQDGVSLHAWFISAPASRGSVLFCHGNGGNISHRIEKAALLRSLGYDVFLFDYRGYGQSNGMPTEKGLYADALGAYDYVTDTRGIDKEHIFVYGESLGGAIAVELALRREVKGVILEGAFTSVQDMARVIYPGLPRFLIAPSYPTIDKIHMLKCPKLIIHSRDDMTVPFDMGQRLFETAPEPKTFLTIRGDHNTGIVDDPAEFVRVVREFLKFLG